MNKNVRNCFTTKSLRKGLILTALVTCFISGQILSPAVMAASATKAGAPLGVFDTTTPSYGKVNALVFKVEFQDVKFASNALNDKDLKKAVFGGENINSSFYPMESVSAYYQRASYGNLSINGEIYSFKVKNKRTYYNQKQEYETLAMEVLSAYDSKIDYSQYDQDKDGYIDCLTFNVPTNGGADDGFWYGCQATWYQNNTYKLDGVKIKGFIINDEQPIPNNIERYNSVMTHEIGHSMGLPDYYKYNSGNDWEGLKGEAGIERMDDAMGDFSSFSKLMYGWIPKEQVQVANLSAGTATYSLASSSETGNCLIVPIKNQNLQYFSEYFLVEYITPSKNYANMFQEGGIRVLHVNAKTITSVYDSRYQMFNYENYSPNYDTSNAGIRILKLVGEDEGFYQTGETIYYGTSQFGIYDQGGQSSIDPGFQIVVGNLVNGRYEVTVQPTK